MSLHDDIIRRWLEEAAADAAPRLDRESVSGVDWAPISDGASEGEFQRQISRLRLVRGLLSTLDMKTAPEELDALVEGAHEHEIVEEVYEVQLSDWVDGAISEPFLEPCKAPEFLDRIVEQRLTAIHYSDLEESSGKGRKALWTGPRRVMAGAILAILFLAAPLLLGERSGLIGTNANSDMGSLQLVSYDSLEGLQKAFPSQSQAANGMGIMGAFGAPVQDSGVPR